MGSTRHSANPPPQGCTLAMPRSGENGKAHHGGPPGKGEKRSSQSRTTRAISSRPMVRHASRCQWRPQPAVQAAADQSQSVKPCTGKRYPHDFGATACAASGRGATPPQSTDDYPQKQTDSEETSCNGNVSGRQERPRKHRAFRLRALVRAPGDARLRPRRQ